MREHDPDKVFKDNDTDHHFEMDSSKLQNLMQQVISDTTFLASRGVLDYSLLVAVASKPHGPPVYTDSRSSFHREFGGVVQEGPYPKVYFIGIIDMLTAWTPAKKVHSNVVAWVAQGVLADLSKGASVGPRRAGRGSAGHIWKGTNGPMGRSRSRSKALVAGIEHIRMSTTMHRGWCGAVRCAVVDQWSGKHRLQAASVFDPSCFALPYSLYLCCTC